MNLKPRNINAGHRERMREKFIRFGIDAFLPHEVLEMLLYYPMLYKDTNPLAHIMIEELGSLGAVLEAPIEKLCEVNGVGEQTALFLKAVSEIGKRGLSHNENDTVLLKNYEILGKYAVACMCDETESCAFLLMLNNRFELMSTVRIPVNDWLPNETLPIQFIVEQAVLKNAPMVAIVTHRTGKASRPDKTEIRNTAKLLARLEAFNIKLLEQYSVVGTHFYGFSNVIPAILADRAKYEEFYLTYAEQGCD